jgi:hypothetical protein
MLALNSIKLRAAFMSTQSLIQKLTTPKNLNRIRFYLRLFFICAFLIIFAVWLDYWFRGEIGTAKKFAEFVGGQWAPGILIGGGILYVLLLSLPFVPGVELGIVLMCAFGKEGIWIESRLQRLGFSQTCDGQVGEIDGMLDKLSLNQLFCKGRFMSFLSKYRYLAIGVLFNTPGNYLIGGGGGISLACGISHSISWKWFLLTVVLAVSPVPLLALFGVIQLEAFLGINK